MFAIGENKLYIMRIFISVEFSYLKGPENYRDAADRTALI